MIRDENASAKPQPIATAILLAGLGLTMMFAEGDTPADLARSHAIGAGLAIAGSFVADYRGSLRNLVRADLMAIVSLYFLTLFEFLVPQPDFNSLLTLREVEPALLACMLGLGSLAAGRHLAPKPSPALQAIMHREISPRTLLLIFSVCFFVGYFYMLLAVDGDVIELVEQFLAPRFSQPWGRGRFGDWKALVGELGMVLYLVPPLSGIVIARRWEFHTGQKIYVYSAFLFTLFYGYTSGTRNIFATYLATFLVAYAFALDRRKKKELITVATAVAALMMIATVTMLEFRNIGFRNYLNGLREGHEKKETTFYVDYNLYVIAKLVNTFPARFDYLGFEIPYLAAIRPIPRAIWSGKPEGMSISMENALGVEGLTVASSFVGEAYMSGGSFGVILTGLFFGAATGWWNRFGRGDNSAIGHLVFASGFFAAVISMRSMFVATTAILPTVAALVMASWLRERRARRKTAPVESPPS